MYYWSISNYLSMAPFSMNTSIFFIVSLTFSKVSSNLSISLVTIAFGGLMIYSKVGALTSSSSKQLIRGFIFWYCSRAGAIISFNFSRRFPHLLSISREASLISKRGKCGCFPVFRHLRQKKTCQLFLQLFSLQTYWTFS